MIKMAEGLDAVKQEKIWMNGKLVRWDDAKVHVLAHGLHYGSSVFEGIRCYDTKNGVGIFRLEEHIDRLMDSAKIYCMDDIGYSKVDLVDACKEVVRTNKLKSAYVRPIIYRGYGGLAVIAKESKRSASSKSTVTRRLSSGMVSSRPARVNSRSVWVLFLPVSAT